ncbi:EG45-like domain containing protein [Pyrus communis]|uniref:EG45-like domain containing protein n=1 Tax=Pyrus communis TaxID=23211 RepID=UPI0035BFFC29
MLASCFTGDKMGMEMRVFIVVAVVAMFIRLPSAAYADEGTATYYTPPYVPSSCNGYQNDGVMIAAASDAIWGNRAACGRRYSVTCIGATNQGVPQPCKGNSVVVKIVDYCPPGCQGTIDLSQEAFAAIANPDAGKIKIRYTQV